MASKFLNTVNPFTVICRFKGYKHSGGIRYPGGIIYFPRFPDEKDPVVVPTKLFRVERVVKMKGIPQVEKNVIHQLGLADIDNPLKGKRVNIIKNIPENNRKLWKIKHLIKITPIVFPYGEPTQADINYTKLSETGVCAVTKELAPKTEQLESRKNYITNPNRLTREYVKRDSRLKWMNPWSGGY